MRVGPGTASGRTERVRGKGVVTQNRTGDLLVTYEVAVPKRISPAERKLIEELAKANGESPRAHLEV